MPNLPINLRRVAIFFGIFILILVVIEFNPRLEDLNRLNGQLDETRARATQSVQTQMALQTYEFIKQQLRAERFQFSQIPSRNLFC